MRSSKMIGGLFVSGIVVAVFCIMTFPRSTAQQAVSTNTAADYEEIFSEKIVGITFDDSTAVVRNDDYSWMINVRIVEIGGRDFIVGESYLPEGEGYEEYQVYKGMTGGYPMERVKSFRTYSEEQFQARMKSSDGHPEDAG